MNVLKVKHLDMLGLKIMGLIHKRAVQTMIYISPPMLFSGGRDGYLRMWHTSSGDHEWRFTHSKERIYYTVTAGEDVFLGGSNYTVQWLKINCNLV